jgi:AraC-like DNA-binding protein
MELCPGLELAIFHKTYPRGFTYRGVEQPHLVQFVVYLSGVVDSRDFLYIDAAHSYIGGSGIQRAVVDVYSDQPEIGVNIHVQPHLFKQFFAASTGELPPELQPLVRGDDWQRVFSPRTTEAMRSVVQQMIDCPLVGVTKRLYLQGKVFELMALQLDAMLNNKDLETSASPKPNTLARIHYAAEILRSQLEYPPSQVELAQQVGVAYCTLHRGFRAAFGVTPFAYLTQQRMKQAEQLLRQLDCTVTEVAHQVGYTNAAQFAAAFKRQFGITPSDCIRGSKITR